MIEEITTYTYDDNPHDLGDDGHREDWRPFDMADRDRMSARAAALFRALGADPADDSLTLAWKPDGLNDRDGSRWGLFEPPERGNRYALESEVTEGLETWHHWAEVFFRPGFHETAEWARKARGYADPVEYVKSLIRQDVDRLRSTQRRIEEMEAAQD